MADDQRPEPDVTTNRDPLHAPQGPPAQRCALSASIKALFDLASGLNAFNSDLAACAESRSEAAATVAAADPSDPNVPQEKGHGPTEPGVPSDMLDPMIIVGEWKLLLGKVDQCWWQGPHYPVRAATFSAVESIGSNRPIRLLTEPCDAVGRMGA